MAIVKGSVQDDLVIVSRGGRSRLTLVLIWLVVIFGMLALGYFAGFYNNKNQLSKVKTERDVLADTLRQSQSNLLELRKRLVVFETSEEIDRISVQRAQEMVKSLEIKNSDLEREVAFYKSIMSPESSGAGLVVNSIDIQSTDILNVYQYSVVLAQLKSNGAFINGWAQITVEGVQDQEVVSLTLDQLQTDVDSRGIAFKFRYFEALEGSLTLPDGFTPEQVLVVLQSKAKNSTRVEKIQTWNFEGDL